MRYERQAGFSLIELAVVLVIIGLLVGGGIAALDATRTQTRRTEQQRQLEHVREALYGFAIVHRRLPCADRGDPDDPGYPWPLDGIEDYQGGSCVAGAEQGALPWATLGLGRRDAWGNPLWYAVIANPGGALEDYADAPPPEGSSFSLGAMGNISVLDDTAGVLIAEDLPAVVLSFGPQGNQVWAGGGYQCPGEGSPAAGFSDNETENCDDDNTFVDAGFSRAESGERFDDQLIWLSDPVLKARMVAAGRLP